MAIQGMLFPDNAPQECFSRQQVRTMLNKTYSDGKKAKEYETKINDKTITQDEVADLMYYFINDFSTMGVKFFKLYNGVYKNAIENLIEHYPDYFIKELIKQMEAHTISRIFTGIAKKLEQGLEGSRGIINYIRALDLAVHLLENKDIEQTDNNITLVQQFVSSSASSGAEENGTISM